MNNVIMIQPVRLSSVRVPRKALAEVGGRRLIDIALAKLKGISHATKIPLRVAAWEGEPELIEAIKSHGIDWQPISERASHAETWTGQFEGWHQDVADYDWAIFLNVICHPFLRAETIVDMIRRTQSAVWPWVSAVSERGLAWDERGNPLLSDGTVALNTKMSPHLLRCAHIGSASAVSDMSEERRILDPRPELFAMSHLERIDIDTQDDLEFARTIAAGLKTQRELK